MLRAFLISVSALCLSLVSYAQSVQRDTVIVTEKYTYEGKWPEGEGVLCSYGHGVIMGNFKEAAPVGVCICWKLNNERYWGDITDWQLTGHGRLFRSGGVVITGDFQKGRQHGIDTVYRKDNSVLIAKYENGKMVEEIGTWTTTPKKLRVVKPSFPDVSLTEAQEAFLSDAKAKYKAAREQKRQEVNRNQVKPRFMGQDINTFSKWVSDNFKYPAEAKKFRTEGMAVVQFTIKTDGKLTDVKIIRSSGSDLLDDELVATIRKSPIWEPATKDGKPVDFPTTMPMIFE